MIRGGGQGKWVEGVGKIWGGDDVKSGRQKRVLLKEGEEIGEKERENLL